MIIRGRRALPAFALPALALPALATLALAACRPEPGTAAGRLLDARTGAPVADVDVRLVAAGDACPPVTARTDAGGRWSAAALCGEAAWTVAPADPGWYLPEPPAAGTDLELRAWRAPPEPGVYTVADATIAPLVTHTLLDTVRVFDSAEEVRFPVEIPGVVPRIGDGVALLIVGDVLPTLAFAPLVPSAERRWFGTKDAPVPVDPWVYLGVRFTSDTVFERVAVTVDAARVTTVGGPRPLRYVGADALPVGRYALPTADGTRAFLLDFGDRPPAQAAPPASAPG